MTQLVGELLKKKSRLSFGFVVNQPPPPPLFFVTVNESSIGRQLSLVLFSPEPLVNVQYFSMTVVFVIYMTQVF